MCPNLFFYRQSSYFHDDRAVAVSLSLSLAVAIALALAIAVAVAIAIAIAIADADDGAIISVEGAASSLHPSSLLPHLPPAVPSTTVSGHAHAPVTP